MFRYIFFCVGLFTPLTQCMNTPYGPDKEATPYSEAPHATPESHIVDAYNASDKIDGEDLRNALMKAYATERKNKTPLGNLEKKGPTFVAAIAELKKDRAARIREAIIAPHNPDENRDQRQARLLREALVADGSPHGHANLRAGQSSIRSNTIVAALCGLELPVQNLILYALLAAQEDYNQRTNKGPIVTHW